MDTKEPDFEALGRAILGYRLRNGLSQKDVAGRGGPSDTTQSQIEAGQWSSARPHGTYAKLDKGYGWPAGTAEMVALGELPVNAIDGVPTRYPRRASTGSFVITPLEEVRTLTTPEIEDRLLEVEARRGLVRTRLADLDSEVAETRDRLNRLELELNRLATERNIRQHQPDDDAPPIVRIVKFDELEKILRANFLVSFDSQVADDAVDIVSMDSAGGVVFVEVENLTSRDVTRRAVAHVERLVGGAKNHNLGTPKGFVLDTEGRPWEELRAQLDAHLLRRTAFFQTGVDPMAEAARDVGRPGKVEKARADQDDATSGSQERPGSEEGA